MKYSVNTIARILFESNSKKEAIKFAYLASRDLAPSTGHSPNSNDLTGEVVNVYDNINSTEIKVYNFTKKAINSIK